MSHTVNIIDYTQGKSRGEKQERGEMLTKH